MKRYFFFYVLCLLMAALPFGQIVVDQPTYGNRCIVRFQIMDLPDNFSWASHKTFKVMAANYIMGPPPDWNWVQQAESSHDEAIIYMSVLQPLEGRFWFVVEGYDIYGNPDYASGQFYADLSATGQAAHQLIMPLVFVLPDLNIQTSYIFVNPTLNPISLTLRFYENRQLVYSRTLDMYGLEQVSGYFCDMPGFPDEFTGWLSIEGSEDLRVMAGYNINGVLSFSGSIQ